MNHQNEQEPVSFDGVDNDTEFLHPHTISQKAAPADDQEAAKNAARDQSCAKANAADQEALLEASSFLLKEQPVSERLQQQIADMESKRGRNHPLKQFQGWLKESGVDLSHRRLIQIAGTNGKGSVTRWLELFLHEYGVSTGSFTSPHLLQHFERLSLNGKPIHAKTWQEIYEQYLPLFEAEQMTMFEIDLFMAAIWFSRMKPDVVLMEVGMGGTYDATTALDYELGLITNIGLDHMAFLGNTKAEIAQAKAGIIKPGMRIFTTETDPVCLAIMQQKAGQEQAEFEPVDAWTGIWNEQLPAYQKANFALALAALEAMGFELPEEREKRDLLFARIQSQFFWPGRFMILRKDPLLVLDGAHNLPGVQALCQSIAPGEFDVLYFSVLADKQAKEMIALLQTKIKRIILVHFDSYRLADLQALSNQFHLPVISTAQMYEQLSGLNQPALICGSLYFAGEVLEHWDELN